MIFRMCFSDSQTCVPFEHVFADAVWALIITYCNLRVPLWISGHVHLFLSQISVILFQEIHPHTVVSDIHAWKGHSFSVRKAAALPQTDITYPQVTWQAEPRLVVTWALRDFAVIFNWQQVTKYFWWCWLHMTNTQNSHSLLLKTS